MKKLTLGIAALSLAACAHTGQPPVSKETAPMPRPMTAAQEQHAANTNCIFGDAAYQHRNCHNDYETVVVGTEIVTSERDRALGVSDGSVHAKDNLTSMGVRASDGANIHRVRASQDQTVTIREAGGSSRDIEVKAGDTLIEVSPGATVVASFSGSGRSVTKASGGHECGGCVETVETEVEVTDSVRGNE